MANQPGENTVATSFTLPRPLYRALKQKATREITNQSDIVRRALMNYLPPEEREMVLKEISDLVASSEKTTAAAAAAGKKVSHTFHRKRGKPSGV